jgi:hypothetical protein
MKHQILSYISNLEKCSYTKTRFLNDMYHYFTQYKKTDINNYICRLIDISLIKEISFEGFELISLNTLKLSRLRKIYKMKKTE